jgi:DNA modification methylase
MKDESIDLTVTSPPYDTLREYDGYDFDFKNTAKRLFRITKNGGVVVWVVGDASIDGSETGSSFKQALYFMECGFRLHDTMIWVKESFNIPSSNRYHQVFEYMFVFSKGSPKTINFINDRKAKYAGTPIHGTERCRDGSTKRVAGEGKIIGDNVRRFNVWNITSSRERIDHPAPFPRKLAHDHIISWSNKGDLVYDPFLGSGTTAMMAHETGRKYIGSEMSKKYFELANDRLSNIHPSIFEESK